MTKGQNEPEFKPPDVSPHVADALDELMLVKNGYPGKRIDEMSVWQFSMRTYASQIIGNTTG